MPAGLFWYLSCYIGHHFACSVLSEKSLEFYPFPLWCFKEFMTYLLIFFLKSTIKSNKIMTADAIQLASTCSKSSMETPEQCVKHTVPVLLLLNLNKCPLGIFVSVFLNIYLFDGTCHKKDRNFFSLTQTLSSSLIEGFAEAINDFRVLDNFANYPMFLEGFWMHPCLLLRNIQFSTI